MDVNDKLKDLRQQKKHYIDKAKKASKERDEMIINHAKREDINTYAPTICNSYTRVGMLNNEIDKICQSIEEHSYFDSNQIGVIIAHLVSFFEGEEYIYQSAKYYPNNKESKENYIKLIVLNSKKQKKHYNERYVNSLIKNGNAIVLTKTEKYYRHTDIYFYKADDLHRVNQNVAFGKFSYVKEFVDGIILYNIKKYQKVISEAELELLELKFIKNKLEEIKKNYEVTDERRIQEFLSSVDHDRKIRERKLQKLLNK